LDVTGEAFSSYADNDAEQKEN